MLTPKSQQSPYYSALMQYVTAALVLITQLAFATPECPTTNAPVKNDNLMHTNAGCLVIHQGKLLVVQALNGRVSIPGGSYGKSESAACTAFRETWEETSLLTRPQEPVYQWPNGFVMFRCKLESPVTHASVQRPLEIKQVLWLDKKDFARYRWRFPRQATWLADWLLRHEKHEENEEYRGNSGKI